MRYFLRIAVASAIMGFALVWGAGDFDAWLKAGAAARAGHLTVLVVGGMLVYVVSLLILGARPRELILRRPAKGD